MKEGADRMSNVKIKILRDGNGNAVKIVKIVLDKSKSKWYNEGTKRKEKENELWTLRKVKSIKTLLVIATK